MNRRKFLRRSGWVVSGASGLLLPINPLLAKALTGSQGRPELSDVNLAAVLTSTRAAGTPAITALASAARADVRGFFRNRFALTPVQEQFISKFTTNEVNGIFAAFQRGLIGANEIQVQLPSPQAPTQGEKCRSMTIERFERRNAAGEPIESWVIKVR